MQIKKHVLCAERLRRVPAQFSWVDQRLVRQRFVDQCDHAALALYLVLVTVADAEGLSYYSDASLERMLHLSAAGLNDARAQLCRLGLIAHEKPLYQVLSLDAPPLGALSTHRAGQVLSVKDVLHRLLEKGSQP